jgi:D-3-phosphoglycerate dehydrogenase
MSKLHIVITDFGDSNVDLEKRVLAPLQAQITVGHCRTEEDVLAIARDADALMVQWAPITRKVLAGLTRCRVISRYGVGVDMIDLVAAREHGIPVLNVPAYCMEEVAAHTLAFLLALGRKIVLQDRLMRQGLWKLGEYIIPMERFREQTLGLIGLGRIGRKVAEFAAPLGIRILGFDIQPPQDPGPVTLADFDTVVREADFLSLHCPLSDSTRHIIDADVFKKMKRTAFLINVGRGGLVDTQALLEVLTRKEIAGAALDVFEQEPLPADHPLRKLENVILTAHSAAYSVSAERQLREDTARNIVDFFQKQNAKAS